MLITLSWKILTSYGIIWCQAYCSTLVQWIAGFQISLLRSSETSKNDNPTSGIPAGLVRWTTAYFWFSHNLHWLHIFQTSEWYIQTSDFYNPLARRTGAFNLKFQSLEWLVTFLVSGHYLNQYWFIQNWTIKKKLWWNFYQNTIISIQRHLLQNAAVT